MEAPFSVRQTIETHGTSVIARTMGVGVSTVHGWKMADALPGAERTDKRGLYEQRLKAFREAVKALEAPPPKAKRKGRAA